MIVLNVDQAFSRYAFLFILYMYAHIYLFIFFMPKSLEYSVICKTVLFRENPSRSMDLTCYVYNSANSLLYGR